ncbi:MAG TPA: helix-turn-helix domain-containing protein [Stellaceae bacterium]|nr:helix-turn-helix domain-containing protein [Stellaceae bacterium]
MARSRGARTGHSKAGAAFTELVLETFRLNGRLVLAGDRLTRDIGLTSARWQVLGTLRKPQAPLTVATIARNMGMQRQSVQRTVNLLVAEGLASLVENPRHRRAKLVALTAKGHASVHKVGLLQVEWANDIAKGMDAGELQAAVLIMRKLRQRLGDRFATAPDWRVPSLDLT